MYTQGAAWPHCQHEYLHLNATVNMLHRTTWHVCMFALYTLITCTVFNQKQKGKCNVKNSYTIVTYLLSRIKACHITFAALFPVSVATISCCTTPNFISWQIMDRQGQHLLSHCFHSYSIWSVGITCPCTPTALPPLVSAPDIVQMFSTEARDRKESPVLGLEHESLNIDKMHRYHGHREKNKECMWKILKAVSPSAQYGSN